MLQLHSDERFAMKPWSMVRVLACVVSLFPGCATGVKGSPRRTCYDAGLKPGTPEFSSCWRRVAHSQGTIVYDDPEAIAIYKGMMEGIGAGVAASNPGASPRQSVAAPPVSGTNTQIILGQQYFATRKSQDLYDLMNGPLEATRFCYEFANSSLVQISGSKLVFVASNRTCDIAQIRTR